MSESVSILTSKSGHYIGYVIDRAPLIMPEEIHGVLDPYLERLDEQLEHDHVEFDSHGHSETEHQPAPAAIPHGDE